MPDENSIQETPAQETAEKPSVFEPCQNDTLAKELGKIYDKHEAKSERQPEFPSREGERLDERVERAYEWSELSKAERVLQSDAAKDVAALKETAAKYGVDMQTAELIRQNHLIAEGQKQAAEYAPVAEHLRSAFSESSPVEAARFFSDVKRSMDADPVGTIAWLASQYGLSPAHVGQRLAQMQPHTPVQLEAVERQITHAASQLEHFADFEDEILGIVSDKNFKRTGDYVADLKSAYNAAVKKEKKLSPDERLEKQLSKIYDKAQARGR